LFGRLQWPEGYSVSSLKWIDPLDNENISAYAHRMCGQVNTFIPFILIGVSLGGIMSIEIAKHIQPERIIIISSIKNKRERPFYFIAGKLFKNVALISPHYKVLLFLISRFFFGRIKRKEFETFRDMLIKTGAKQIRWAQNEVLKWNNQEIPTNLVHIHGTADIVFPALFIKDYIPIKGGTHYMIVNRAEEISKLLKELI
jgi:hypothetical protein